MKYFHIMGCSLIADIPFGRRIVEAMECAAVQGVKISFDPNIRPELLKDPEAMELVSAILEQTSIFMPGKSELKLLSGCDDIDAAVEQLFRTKKNLEILVLKNGSKGCAVYTRQSRFAMGVCPIEAVDATGAGDSFDGAFLCGLLDGKSLEDAARMATAAAALNTCAFGPMEGNISPETVAGMIAAHPLPATEF